GIGARPHLVLEGALLRLIGHVDAAPGHVELPAVIGAAKPALFVASEKQRGATMRAIHRQEPDLPARVAEGNQVLAEQAQLLGWAVGGGKLARGQAGHPVLTQERSHGGAASNPAEEIVVFTREHRYLLLVFSLPRTALLPDREGHTHSGAGLRTVRRNVVDEPHGEALRRPRGSDPVAD